MRQRAEITISQGTECMTVTGKGDLDLEIAPLF
jgi:hypothetical protein